MAFARHMPHHQVTQLLTETAALRRLQIIHQREDALALRGVSWDVAAQQADETEGNPIDLV